MDSVSAAGRTPIVRSASRQRRNTRKASLVFPSFGATALRWTIEK
jgi:hypothetical protein